MIWIFLTIILFLVLAAGAAFGAWYCFDNEKTGGGVACIFGVIFAIILFITVPFSFHQVDAGEIAVVKRMGAISGTRDAGLHYDFWMVNQYEIYDAKVQNVDITTQAYSKDAQTMDVALTVQFQIQRDHVTDIAVQYGNLSALENKIQNVVIERTKSVLSQYSAMSIIENRGNISPEVERIIKESIDESYYVSITTAVLSNIDFSDVFEQTVEDKMVAEQEKLKAEYEKEKAIIEAEKELEVAKLQAQARIAAAEGDAEAQKITADAEAYAASVKIVELAKTLGYEIIEIEITEEDEVIGTEYKINWGEDGYDTVLAYIQYLEYLSKWNGELPSVVAGDSLSIFVPNN